MNFPNARRRNVSSETSLCVNYDSPLAVQWAHQVTSLSHLLRLSSHTWILAQILLPPRSAEAFDTWSVTVILALAFITMSRSRVGLYFYRGSLGKTC